MRYPDFAHEQYGGPLWPHGRTDGRTYTIAIDINTVGARSRSPQSYTSENAAHYEASVSEVAECTATSRMYSRLYCTVARPVALCVKQRRQEEDSVGESWDREQCLALEWPPLHLSLAFLSDSLYVRRNYPTPALTKY